MNVKRAGHGIDPTGTLRHIRGRWGQREQDEEQNSGEGNRCGESQETCDVKRPQRPASARSAWALSVRSHVNSGSVRPKCPNAAVFL